jgi:hypothetical protein
MFYTAIELKFYVSHHTNGTHRNIHTPHTTHTHTHTHIPTRLPPLSKSHRYQWLVEYLSQFLIYHTQHLIPPIDHKPHFVNMGGNDHFNSFNVDEGESFDKRHIVYRIMLDPNIALSLSSKIMLPISITKFLRETLHM